MGIGHITPPTSLPIAAKIEARSVAHRRSQGHEPGSSAPGPTPAAPLPNILGRHPQHPRERQPRIGSVAHERLGPARLAGRAVSKEPLNSNYISLCLWGLLLQPAFGGLPRGPHAGNGRLISLAANGSASPPPLVTLGQGIGQSATANQLPPISRGSSASAISRRISLRPSSMGGSHPI